MGGEMNSYSTFTKSQKIMISRIVFVLKKSHKLNTNQIHDILRNIELPCYSPKSLYLCLKELQIAGIVNCEIIRTKDNEPQTVTDYFSLTMNADGFLEQLHADGFSYDRVRKKLAEEFVILKCRKCNSYRCAHSQFKTIKCFNCGQIFLPSNIIMRVKTKKEAILLLRNLKSSITEDKEK